MSDKVYEEFAGVKTSTRVRKPPGGESSDIFGLETRQKCPVQQNNAETEVQSMENNDQGGAVENTLKEPSAESSYLMYFDYEKKEQNQMHCRQMQSMYHTLPNEKQEFVQENKSNVGTHDHDIPLASGKGYAGLTNKTRVRKQPGGDTHDIFGMESRQAEERRHVWDDEGNKPDHEQASMGSLTKITNNQKSGPVNVENCEELFLQVDKENIDILREEIENIMEQKSHGDEEDLDLPTKMYLTRNPITGEVSERKVSKCLKLVDCSNVDMSQSPVQKPQDKKTSVKISQPPGGVSSFFF